MAKMYCGQAAIRQTKIGQVVSIELDLTELRVILGEAAQGQSEAQIREWTDKGGVVHKTIKLEAVPMKEPGKYSTHTIKLNTYVKDIAAPGAAAPVFDKRNEYIHDAVVTPQVVDDGGLPF
jgi:hypothetical protein